MNLFKTSNTTILRLSRNLANNAKPIVKLDEDVSDNINNAVFKPRHHPGRIKPRTVTLPDSLIKAVENVVEDHPIRKLVDDSSVLARHLCARFPPVEKEEFKKIRKEVLQEVLNKEPRFEIKTDRDGERFKQSVNDKLKQKLTRKIYNWTAVNYNVYNSLLYLFGRFAPEYAVLVRLFTEIYSRDTNFKPRSFFDFGSGTGTATWAANLYWKKHIFEYFNVDSSADMNDLARLLLQGGRGTKPINLKGTFYRQFLPANNIAFDLVVCAYSLLELPSLEARLQTILNLWNKTVGYLVVVEHGTNAGFKIINEVRDFILSIENEANEGHIFSPCPHDTLCPRFLTDNTPCNFEVSYMPLPFSGPSTLQRECYSYVVLKKGKRNKDDLQWPRIVRLPLVRSKHVVCRMCTNKGKLEEVIFTAAKHGKVAYHCARSSEWGDMLPIQLQENENIEDPNQQQ